ncbi:hypothetical protein LUZ63_012598 [Rhynchospora breviuscula]|uniref:Uncharacterized protein n=1 Tax=Rhynchospora breviuscula TaxID=2022672 RepID=A0A9Q0CLD9_9POAL|nr:hypothetical protein LUZ63_012598 [Rhynchospora breviuscula]
MVQREREREREVGVVAMEDAIDALLERLVQPLLSSKMVPNTKPPISQQQHVAKQMHVVAIMYNYYYRKHCPEFESLPFDALCKIAVNSNGPLLAYLDIIRSNSDKPSTVEESIMLGCNIATVLSDQDQSKIETWPIETVAVFLVDAKREKCFLNKDTLVKGVFSLVEKDVEGQKAGDEHKKIAVSEVESLTGINRANLRTWYSQCTYSLWKMHSRTMVFLVECSEPPTADKGFVRVSIKDVLDSLRSPVFAGGSKHELTPVVDFICLLPYADIISDGLSKPTTELEELEKSHREPAKSPMKIDNPQVKVKKKQSNGSLKANNGNDNPANKREHATTVVVPFDFPSVKHVKSYVGPSDSSPTKDSMCSFVGPSSNGSLKPIKKGEECGNNKRENRTVEEISKDIKLEIVNANKELVIANSNPCIPTKRPITEASVKQEIVPVAEKDYESCLYQLMGIMDCLFRKHRVDEDKITQCEMDYQIAKREGQMTPKVAIIAERWRKTISKDGQLDFSVGCSNPNKKKKFRFRSSCQELDDFCRDNNLPLPRYCVYPSMTNGLFMATAMVKSMDIDCMVESDLKMTPQDAREEAASRLMQKFKEMDED